MDRVRLKNTILAVVNQILSTCSDEQLQSAVHAFECGEPIRLKPYKPVDIKDYDFLIDKITRAFAYKPRRIARSRVINKPTLFPNLFTVNVPIKIDTSKLSKMESQILHQNLDKVLLITMHQPHIKKGHIETRARIGVLIKHLKEDQKEYVGIKTDYIKTKQIDFYKSYVNVALFNFMPIIMHDFYKKLLWKEQFFGVPP